MREEGIAQGADRASAPTSNHGPPIDRQGRTSAPTASILAPVRIQDVGVEAWQIDREAGKRQEPRVRTGMPDNLKSNHSQAFLPSAQHVVGGEEGSSGNQQTRHRYGDARFAVAENNEDQRRQQRGSVAAQRPEPEYRRSSRHSPRHRMRSRLVPRPSPRIASHWLHFRARQWFRAPNGTSSDSTADRWQKPVMTSVGVSPNRRDISE
jgi:hypothetical protein